MSSTTEYLLAFSSFYKAAYAQEFLGKKGIPAVLRKLPPGLLQSCGYGLILRTESKSLKRAMELLEGREIRPKGVFSVRRDANRIVYDKVYF